FDNEERQGSDAMKVLSRVILCGLAAALIAGCGSAPYRSGKGNDHLSMYRPANVQEPKVVEKREVVYVRQPVQPAYVYYEPVPAYRVVPAQPVYTTVPPRAGYRYDPVTHYYYYTDE